MSLGSLDVSLEICTRVARNSSEISCQVEASDVLWSDGVFKYIFWFVFLFFLAHVGFDFRPHAQLGLI